MKYLRICATAFLVLGIVALSAGPALAVVAPALHGHGNQNLTGQYSGTVTDSNAGTGTAIVNLAQYDALGGDFTFTFGSTTYDNAASGSITWGGMQGVFVATIASAACSFAFRASYNPSTFVLSGKYKAINGCSGETGTFAVTQQCYYNERRGDLRRQGGGIMPC